MLFGVLLHGWGGGDCGGLGTCPVRRRIFLGGANLAAAEASLVYAAAYVYPRRRLSKFCPGKLALGSVSTSKNITLMDWLGNSDGLGHPSDAPRGR